MGVARERTYVSLAIAALLGCAPPPASAPEPATLTIGLRVRATTKDGAWESRAGTVTRLGPDSIWIGVPCRELASDCRLAPGDFTVGFAFETLKRLDVSRGPRSRQSASNRAGALGFLIGAGFGAALGAAAFDPDAFLANDFPGYVGLSAAVLGGVGLLIGALYGEAAPGERWQRLRIPERATPFSPPLSGSGVGAALPCSAWPRDACGR
jgi:hypothetical protein